MMSKIELLKENVVMKKFRVLCSEPNFKKTDDFIFSIKNYINYIELYRGFDDYTEEEILKLFKYKGFRYVEIEVSDSETIDEIIEDLNSNSRFGFYNISDSKDITMIGSMNNIFFDSILYEKNDNHRGEKVNVFIDNYGKTNDKKRIDEVNKFLKEINVSDITAYDKISVDDLELYSFYFRNEDEFNEIIKNLKKIDCSFICKNPFSKEKEVISNLKLV